jgi:hypothetical protein
MKTILKKYLINLHLMQQDQPFLSTAMTAFTAGLFLTVVDPQNPPIQPENLPSSDTVGEDALSFNWKTTFLLFGIALGWVIAEILRQQ